MWFEIVICGVLVLATLAVYDYFYNAGTNAPGPFGLPFVYQLIEAHRILGRLDEYLDETRRIYGPTFLMRAPAVPPFIVTVDPANVEHVLKTKFSNYIKGEFFTSNLEDVLGKGIFNVDGEAWKRQRKITSHMFNVSNFRNGMTHVFRFHLRELCSVLETKLAKPVDLHEFFHRFTLDSICQIAFGKNLGSIRNSRLPFVVAWDTTNETVIYRMILHRYIRQLFIAEENVSYKVKLLRGFARDIIQERRDEQARDLERFNSRSDLLSLYLARTDDTGQMFTDDYLIDMVLNIIIAGRDTTAQSLAWTVKLLCENPEVFVKLREEIDRVLGSSKPCDYTTSQQMKYLMAVIHESLRLYPSVPRDIKQAVEDDVLPDGTRVPKGYLVVYFPYGMGRCEAIWGPDARAFRPERFLNPAGDFIKPSPFAYPVFQAGPRTCLGQNMALLEQAMVLATLVQRYDLEMVPDQNFEIAFNLTCPMKNGLQVVIRPRAQHCADGPPPRLEDQFSADTLGSMAAELEAH
ncbi:hypothetical protein H696_03822 [Fonticula alba]|uniref:Cytochrome P450 n=1 Tax=Fonticula alba TaxID=691883 RepID=A0A058Z5J7_FONAL|nr:hypothetical protein H696_03822 [Fonticula alba]KCV69391.1 hypothetical protein H696_03822 [Fonticula alba]|eukprot:XP_009495956.1 hypothetical protein H696_03822 [Fonticula alba]